MSFYVYGIFQDENSPPFYIGKGSGYRTHATLKSNHCSFLKLQKIESLKKEGITPIVKILEEFENENDALIYEKMVIGMYGKIIDKTGILTNLSDGGEISNTGWIPSDETKKLWSRQRTGHKQSQTHIQKRIQKNIGKKRSIEQKEHSKVGAILRRKESLLPIISRLENQKYFHGMYASIASELNERPERIKRVYENLEFYKEVLIDKQE